MLERIPFKYESDQIFLQTSSGTPLWHIEQQENDDYFLYPKLGGKPVKIPQADHSHGGLTLEHQALSCDSCHASWIPTCLGCHMSYDNNQKQWDHTLQKFSPGAWLERRWNTDTGPATLGRLNANTVDVFMPGMIMSLDHPTLDKTRFIRRFASISPHTTGPGRSCKNCHRSSVALGLGKGQLNHNDGRLEFQPKMAPLADGLPADAWTNMDKSAVGSDHDYPRPFTALEIEKLYEVQID